MFEGQDVAMKFTKDEDSDHGDLVDAEDALQSEACTSDCKAGLAQQEEKLMVTRQHLFQEGVRAPEDEGPMCCMCGANEGEGHAYHAKQGQKCETTCTGG